MVPDVAIIDPSIPAKMPKKITANTGMDVLVHATEAIVSSASNDYADALAIQAVKFIFKYLKRAYDNPDDMEAREKMHNASAMAGMAFTSSASLGIVHSMAHILGGRFGITHGLANAILLPYVTQFNRKATDKVAWIEEELGVEDFPKAVKELNESLNIPLTLKDAGFGLEDADKFASELSEMCEVAQADPCTFTNPRETTPEIIKDIYEHAYKGEDITD